MATSRRLLAVVLILMLAWIYPALMGEAADVGRLSDAGASDPHARNGVAAAVSCNAYEPNDGLGTMHGPVAPGTELRAKLCTPNDLDYYYIRAQKSQALVIRLTLPSALVGHVSLWVYNGQGQALFGRHSITSASTTLRYTLPRNAKYIVGLYSHDHTVATGAAYTLKLNFLELVTPTATATRTRTAAPPTATPRPATATRTRTAAPPTATSTTPPTAIPPTPTPPPPTATPLPTATPTRTPLPTYWLTVKGIYSGGSNGTFQVTHGVPHLITASESHPCGQEGFDRWVVTSGSAAIDSPTSPSTTVRVYSDATISTMYCGVVAQ